MNRYSSAFEQFSYAAGFEVALPRRTVEDLGDDCLIEGIVRWRDQIAKLAEDVKGECILEAQALCTRLTGKLASTPFTKDAPADRVESHKQSIDEQVHKAISLGFASIDSGKKMSSYLVAEADKLLKQTAPTDSTRTSREHFLFSADRAAKMMAAIESTLMESGADIQLDSKTVAKLMELLVQLQTSAPTEAAVANLDGARKQALASGKPELIFKAEADYNAAFSDFSSHVKALLSLFPEGSSGVAIGKNIINACSPNLHQAEKGKLDALCQQVLSAQNEAKQRANRTLPTPVRQIITAIASQHEASGRSGEARARKAENWNQLSSATQSKLLKQAATLNEADSTYGTSDLGWSDYGMSSISGGAALVKSVAKHTNRAVDEMQALAGHAGMSCSLERQDPEAKRLLVSDLVRLDEKHTQWAKENSHLMDLSEIKYALSQLGRRKSSDPAELAAIQADVDLYIEKAIIACVDGDGNATQFLGHIVSEAAQWKPDVPLKAKASCDCIVRRAGDALALVNKLNNLQTGSSILLPELSGSQVVAIAKVMEPLSSMCLDEGGVIKA